MTIDYDGSDSCWRALTEALFQTNHIMERCRTEDAPLYAASIVALIDAAESQVNGTASSVERWFGGGSLATIRDRAKNVAADDVPFIAFREYATAMDYERKRAARLGAAESRPR